MQYNTPDDIYGDLYHDLHVSALWKDGKKISDAVPRISPNEIVKFYQKEKGLEDFDLKKFFKAHFKNVILRQIVILNY